MITSKQNSIKGLTLDGAKHTSRQMELSLYKTAKIMVCVSILGEKHHEQVLLANWVGKQKHTGPL